MRLFGKYKPTAALGLFFLSVPLHATSRLRSPNPLRSAFCEVFFEVEVDRDKGFLPPFVRTIQIPGRSPIIVGEFLGSSVSRVFKSRGERFAIKFYALKDSEFSEYEYWATQYYQENEVPVAEVISPPIKVKGLVGERAVLVKRLVRGFTMEEIEQVLINKQTSEAIGIDPETGVIVKTGQTFHETKARLKEKIQFLHSNKKFEKWLLERNVSLWDDPVVEVSVQGGDFKNDNILWTQDGLVVIDP